MAQASSRARPSTSICSRPESALSAARQTAVHAPSGRYRASSGSSSASSAAVCASTASATRPQARMKALRAGGSCATAHWRATVERSRRLWSSSAARLVHSATTSADGVLFAGRDVGEQRRPQVRPLGRVVLHQDPAHQVGVSGELGGALGVVRRCPARQLREQPELATDRPVQDLAGSPTAAVRRGTFSVDTRGIGTSVVAGRGGPRRSWRHLEGSAGPVGSR